MSARAIASATVSFGLVSIPVKIYASGDTSSGVRFNLVHKTCGSRLKQQYVCPQDGEIVSREDMAKGYEFSKGQYVLFSDEELKALMEKPTHTVDITEFLPTEKVDPIYFDKSYYLGPDKGGDRAYRLLSRALEKSGRSALAKYAARGKQYVVMLRPMQGGLVMQQLRYSDEVRSFDEVPLGESTVKPAELKLALQIVDQAVSEKFEPENYEDDVRARIIHQIERKVDGQEITAEPAEEPKAQVIDLMEALKSSLADKRKPAKSTPRSAAKASSVKKRKKADG